MGRRGCHVNVVIQNSGRDITNHHVYQLSNGTFYADTMPGTTLESNPHDVAATLALDLIQRHRVRGMTGTNEGDVYQFYYGSILLSLQQLQLYTSGDEPRRNVAGE